MGQLGLRLWVRVVSAPESIVFATALLLCTVGVYLSTGDLVGVYVMLIFAGIGYLMTATGYSVVVFVIAFFLGPRFELSLSQTLGILGDDPVRMLDHPVGLGLLGLAVAAAWWMGVRQRRR
jgi:putative tricarboxylic transport membrane protein